MLPLVLSLQHPLEKLKHLKHLKQPPQSRFLHARFAQRGLQHFFLSFFTQVLHLGAQLPPHLLNNIPASTKENEHTVIITNKSFFILVSFVTIRYDTPRVSTWL